MGAPEWLELLAPLPGGEGECQGAPMPGPPLVGWHEVRLVLGNGVTGLRVVTAMYDPDGRPGMVNDLVATDGGARQESAGARIEPDGRLDGAHWLTTGDRHTPRPLSDAEREGLRRLADALWRRWSAGRGA
jgi:hypothetical protein